MSVYNSEGVQYKEPKLKVMGLDMVKSSTPAVIRKKLKEVLPLVLRGTQDEVQDFVSKFEIEFRKLAVEDIAFPRGTTDIEKYFSSSNIYTKGTPAHIRGSLLYNHFIRKMNLTHKYQLIHNGDKIKFVYLKKNNPVGDNCIAFLDKLPEEFDLHRYIDYDEMFEKVFKGSVQNVIECLGWTTEHVATLEDWFV